MSSSQKKIVASNPIRIGNPSAGIGDPYWYEWSVGLYYALDMLDTDSGIEYVQLQTEDTQKLDDVVVTWQEGQGALYL